MRHNHNKGKRKGKEKTTGYSPRRKVSSVKRRVRKNTIRETSIGTATSGRHSKSPRKILNT